MCASSAPMGFYRFNRLLFELNRAPEVFQGKNEEIHLII